MTRKTPKPTKTAVVAFKVEAELAEFLDKLPNKSAFIRKAIAAQLSMSCPLCNGAGVVTSAAHHNYMQLLLQSGQRGCDGCGDKLEVPGDPGALAADDRARMEQYFHGGPLFCDDCYVKAPTCGDCGWHIAPEKVTEHRHVHDE